MRLDQGPIAKAARAISFYDMRVRWQSVIAVSVAACSMMMLGHSPASACNAVLVGLSIEDARVGLARATRANSLAVARDYAKDAYDGLRDTELTLKPCGCREAALEFAKASGDAKRAWTAFKADGFAQDLNAAIRHFNKAVAKLNACRPKQRT
jgi:hypothetical protein